MDFLPAELIAEISPIINSLVLAVLGYIASVLGLKAKEIMEEVKRNERLKRIQKDLEINKEIIQASVDYVEQFGRHLGSTEKFRLAKDKAYQIMAELGVEMSDTEVEVLIEQFVGAYNKERSYKDDVYLDNVEDLK